MSKDRYHMPLSRIKGFSAFPYLSVELGSSPPGQPPPFRGPPDQDKSGLRVAGLWPITAEPYKRLYSQRHISPLLEDLS